LCKNTFITERRLTEILHYVQAEFEFDRIDYLDTIRRQDRALKWYQAVVEQILPALRRDSNYVDLERVRAASEWDDLNCRWKLPRFSVEKKLTLPPATGGGGSGAFPGRSSAASMMSPAGSSSLSGDLDYELRSEERLIEKLNESAMRDPAAAYFRSSTRTGSATGGARGNDRMPSRSSNSLASKSTTPVPLSPMPRRHYPM